MAKEKEIDEGDFKDLKPQNRRKRKEPPKPWGKFERLVIFFVLLATVLTATILSVSARNWKLPNMPRLKPIDLKNFFLFKEQTIVVGNHGFEVDQQKIQKIRADFNKATNSNSGIYAFYIYDLNGDYYYGENHQELMQAASLIKLPVMKLAFDRLEEGSLDEDDTLLLLEAMGRRSDNTAFNKMVEILGEVEIQNEINNLGMSSTLLDENQTTPEDIGIFFKKLYNGELLSQKYTKLYFEYLTDTVFEQWLRPGIPKDIVLSHKYGRETHSVSDAGVVFSDKPFVLVIMTDGVVESEADSLFPTLSELLYDGHTNQTD